MSKTSRHPHSKNPTYRQSVSGRRATRKAPPRSADEEDVESAFGSSSTRRISLTVVVLLVFVLILAIAVPVLISLMPDDKDSTGASEKAMGGRGRRGTLPEVDESKVTSLSDEDVARAFLAAESWEERKKLVRDADEASAHLEKYPEEVKTYPIPVERIRSRGTINPGDTLPYDRFEVRMKSGGKRFLCVVQTEQGPRVDYDAFARYATATWEELQNGQAATEARLTVEMDTYFNHLFTDETKWACFKLTSPDWPKTAWGYAPRGSMTAKVLSELVSAEPKRFTLALRSEESSHSRSQFVIERVVAEGWVRTPLGPEELRQMLQGEPEALGTGPVTIKPDPRVPAPWNQDPRSPF